MLLRAGRAAFRANALKFVPTGRLNLALRIAPERAKPGIPHPLSGLYGFHRHMLYRSDSVAIGVPFSGY